MSDEEAAPFEDDLIAMIDRSADYYHMLIARGIPEQLAIRIVGDWYNGCVTVGVGYYHNRMRKASDALTRRMVGG